MNVWLFGIIQMICAGVITGVGLTALLVMDKFTSTNAIWCFLLSAVVALPVGYLIYKKMDQ